MTTEHVTQEQALEVADVSGLWGCEFSEFEGRLCAFANAAIQHYIDQQAKELPRLPAPDVHGLHAFSESTLKAYGAACAAHAREMALSEAKLVAKTTCHHESNEFANGFNMAALNIESAIEALKGK